MCFAVLTERMNRHRLWFAWAVVIVGTGLLANRAAVYLYSLSASPAEPGSDSQLIPPESLKLGRVYDGSVFEHTVRIRNPYNAPLHLGRFRASCDCLRITPGAGTVIPGNETRVFQIQLSPQRASQNPDSWEEQHIRINFGVAYTVEGLPPSRADWTFVGTLVRTLRLDPAMIHLGASPCNREDCSRRD
jgi:hypothetical protein